MSTWTTDKKAYPAEKGKPIRSSPGEAGEGQKYQDSGEKAKEEGGLLFSHQEGKRKESMREPSQKETIKKRGGKEIAMDGELRDWVELGTRETCFRRKLIPESVAQESLGGKSALPAEGMNNTVGAFDKKRGGGCCDQKKH